MILSDMKDCKWNGNDIKKLMWNDLVLWEQYTEPPKVKKWVKVAKLPEYFNTDYGTVLYKNSIYNYCKYSDVYMVYHYYNKTNGGWSSLGELYTKTYIRPVVVNVNETLYFIDDGSIKKLDGYDFVYEIELPHPVHEYAVVIDNSIHTLGGVYDGNEYDHYIYNTNSKTIQYGTPLPMGFGSTTVYNNEIHIFAYGEQRIHYKLNKYSNTWEFVSTLPFDGHESTAIVYEDEIHFFGDGFEHYKLNKTNNTWQKVSDLPNNMIRSSAICYDGEINIFTTEGKYHYVYR